MRSISSGWQRFDVSGLRKCYGDIVAVDSIDFEIVWQVILKPPGNAIQA